MGFNTSLFRVGEPSRMQVQVYWKFMESLYKFKQCEPGNVYMQTCIHLQTFCMSAYRKQFYNTNYSKSPQWINLILVSSEKYPYLLMQQISFEV